MQTPVLLGLLKKMAAKAPLLYPQVLLIFALKPFCREVLSSDVCKVDWN
jgi:hypothetical protein